ncbi:putative Splicing factor U2AF-associated protein 2 [Glarea lozoyensis 74030]|uniref:Putative Splicing factor U2AF-associated protein 2 n=1 Tax=Glarea lozoyensis (strain ATCC 74030 / MF5533) TaxID=1104152 RepID=H0EJP8_GLAL7|nr:putative Splicing factor U2AF-associated protein 2 [Glarea lozoyensis 74030]
MNGTPSTSSSAAGTAASSFPTDPSEFDADDRISFSKLDNKFLLVVADGTEYEFDDAIKRWIPVVDEALLEQQQKAYQVEGVDESEPVDALKRKRKKEYVNGEDEGGREKKAPKKTKAPLPPKANTAVYVTGLPFDVTIPEVHEVFSRKCGVIAEEIDSGAPRIKLYTDSKGIFKGDALIVFFKPPSVDMAIMLLDDTQFRMADGEGSGRMRVQAADMSYKRVQNDTEVTAKDKEKEKERQRTKARDKQKIIKKTQKLDARLADWNDPAAILDIKEDIREECSKLGEVTNVVLFDLEEEGIASVRFTNAEAAKACVILMNGRNFDGQKVEAYVSEGKEVFKKSKKKEDETSLDD